MTTPRIWSHSCLVWRLPSHTNICQRRWLHANRPQPPIPSPIPFVPDVETFLTLIGRGLKQHAAKFPSWEALFSLTSDELRELGIEPPKTRKYLLHWLHKFRRGEFGPGGDFKHVQDGEAILRAVTIPVDRYRDLKKVYNVPAVEAASPDSSIADSVLVKGYKVTGARAIAGPYVLPAAGGKFGRVKPTEGMWEHKVGRKIDGGERRRAEVRFKRGVAERKAQREAELR